MLDIASLIELGGLFIIAFLAATLVPLGSEAVLLGVIAHSPELSVLAFVIATLGNTLGGLTNCLLGRYFLHYQKCSWFPISQQRLAQVHDLFVRYGQISLLFSWLPLIGDGLCVAAGIARVRLLYCAIWIGLGKGGRYAAIVWGTKALLLS